MTGARHEELANIVRPFVYRKYLSFAEINEVKALKRRMEQRTTAAGADDHDVKTGRGGIRDIEYTVQFLQLLNGGDLPAVRQRNTLLALEALEIAGCLTGQETYILADAYRPLRQPRAVHPGVEVLEVQHLVERADGGLARGADPLLQLLDAERAPRERLVRAPKAGIQRWLSTNW